MSKKPAATAASPPATGLSPEAQAWFTSVEENYELRDHHRKLLTAACVMWDRAAWARAVLDKDGMTFRDRFGSPKPKPEIAIERDSINAFRQLVHELGLDDEAASPNGSRPPHPNSKRAVYFSGN